MAGFFPLIATLDQATAKQLLYANSVLKMYKSTLVPDEQTVIADLDAAEADFDGYAALTLVAWGDPILAPGNGYAIYAPFQFQSAAPNTTLNSIGGMWLELAAGDLAAIYPFDAPLPLGEVGQGIASIIAEYFRTGFGASS